MLSLETRIKMTIYLWNIAVKIVSRARDRNVPCTATLTELGITLTTSFYTPARFVDARLSTLL
jgi:hypothetical protein